MFHIFFLLIISDCSFFASIVSLKICVDHYLLNTGAALQVSVVLYYNTSLWTLSWKQHHLSAISQWSQWSHCLTLYCEKPSFHIFSFFFLFVVNFVIHWNKTAMGLHVLPIPIPPPTPLFTRSPQVFPMHQVREPVPCIQPGLVICLILDTIHVSMLFNIFSYIFNPELFGFVFGCFWQADKSVYLFWPEIEVPQEWINLFWKLVND